MTGVQDSVCWQEHPLHYHGLKCILKVLASVEVFSTESKQVFTTAATSTEAKCKKISMPNFICSVWGVVIYSGTSSNKAQD